MTNGQFTLLNGSAAASSESRFEGYPRDTITALEAVAFCTLRDAQLITELEWEYAASGPDNLMYPWGDEWNPDYVVWEENSDGESTYVGESRFEGASWVGALDMSGNVWEWTRSIENDYPYNADDGREVSFNVRSNRIMRGGSWTNQPELLITSRRFGSWVGFSTDYIGFRCMRPYEVEE